MPVDARGSPCRRGGDAGRVRYADITCSGVESSVSITKCVYICSRLCLRDVCWLSAKTVKENVGVLWMLVPEARW